MEQDQDIQDEGFVEAIEDGRIVKVLEVYAKREGLPIIRKSRMEFIREQMNSPYSEDRSLKKSEDRSSPRSFFVESLQKPRDWKENQVISELVDNFGWLVSIGRKHKGVTRKQLARMINEPEDHIKMIEYGRLPSYDFVLINKLQDFFGISLRKDGRNFTRPIKDIFSVSRES